MCQPVPAVCVRLSHGGHASLLQVSYALSPTTQTRYPDVFSINPQTGALSLTSNLDYETTQSHVLDVIARDAGSESSQVQTSIAIEVRDVNDFAPKITISALGGGSVMENSDAGNSSTSNIPFRIKCYACTGTRSIQG